MKIIYYYKNIGDSENREGVGQEILKLWAHDASLYAKSKRAYKWETFKLIRAKQHEEMAKKFYFFTLIRRIFLYLYYYDKARK